MKIFGNYEVEVQIGGKTATGKPVSYPLDFGSVESITIIQDMESLLPTLRMRVADSSGILTHIQPFDSSMNKISVNFKEATNQSGPSRDTTNTFVFKVFRKKPIQLQGASAFMELVGFLDLENMFSPSQNKCTVEGETIAQFLARIADDMASDDSVRYDISPSLQYQAPVYQPNWTNSELFFDLRKRLRGNTDDSMGNFKIFFSKYGGENHLICMTWNELVKSPVKYRFVYGDKPAKEDVLNVFNCKNFDNYGLYGVFGMKKQRYGYYDYWNSEFKEETVNLDFIESLTKYHLIDGGDSSESDSTFYGRNSEATPDFKEQAINVLYERAQNLSKMWADTYGHHNMQPGDIIQIEYGHNIGESPTNFQYSGLWMVERVIHIIEKSYFTRMLLTRTGIDTERTTTLVKAKSVKMQTKLTGTNTKVTTSESVK